MTGQRNFIHFNYFNFFNFLSHFPRACQTIELGVGVEKVEIVEIVEGVEGVEVLDLGICDPSAMSSPRFERALRAFKARCSPLGWRRSL